MVNAEITEEINTRQSWICMADVLRAYEKFCLFALPAVEYHLHS